MNRNPVDGRGRIREQKQHSTKPPTHHPIRFSFFQPFNSLILFYMNLFSTKIEHLQFFNRSSFIKRSYHQSFFGSQSTSILSKSSNRFFQFLSSTSITSSNDLNQSEMYSLVSKSIKSISSSKFLFPFDLQKLSHQFSSPIWLFLNFFPPLSSIFKLK